jgi:hypothetical protein
MAKRKKDIEVSANLAAPDQQSVTVFSVRYTGNADKFICSDGTKRFIFTKKVPVLQMTEQEYNKIVKYQGLKIIKI